MKIFILSVALACICHPLSAQTIGSKVSFTAVDGKVYTGVVLDVQGNTSKVRYDNTTFEAWLDNATLTLTGGNAGTQQQTPVTNNTAWKIGDKVDVQDMYNNYAWEAATIITVNDYGTSKTFRASLDNPAGHAITDLLLTTNQIRPRGMKATKFNVGQHVNAAYGDMKPKGKAKIIEDKGNGRYKVHYDGCGNYMDEEVDWSQLSPASVIAPNHPDLSSLFGKWAMFVYSYPNTVIRGENVYREYGTGAKAPPLQINANGSYVWYDEYNKPPVKGSWEPDAMVAGVTMGTDSYNGILLKDSHGVVWKIHQDRQDHIEARKQCSGETEGGTRIK